MKTTAKKIICYILCAVLVTAYIPFSPMTAFADSVIEIFDEDGTQITEIISLTEYRSVQLLAMTPATGEDGTVTGSELDTSNGSYVVWKSNLPLLANVDSNGKVTAYDYSKRAVIQLWIDENIRTLPLVGDSTAEAIWAALDSTGTDLDDMSTDAIVAVVSTIAGETLAESLRTALDNMNVEITATYYSADGAVLGSDTVEILVEKSIIASVAPTGVHITNKNDVPVLVAVGATVQLYGVCTPTRLEQGVKWSISSGSDCASVDSNGLVTFTQAGSVTVKLQPESTLYAAFSDTVTFTVVEQSELPVESFEITGTTSVTEGETTQLAISNVVPAGAYVGDLSWSSADTSIAVVDAEGIVTGLNGGDGLTYSQSVVITATAGSLSKTVSITVNRPIIASLTSISITGDAVLGIGASAQYTSDVTPERLNTSSSVSREWGVYDYNTGSVIYATADTPATDGIISVDSNGNATGVATGVSKLYAKATYGSSSVETYIEVTSGNAITDFEITGNTDLDEGETAALSINVLAPSDYEASLLETVKWSVDDDSIVYVSQDGVILGRDAGGRNSSKTTTVYATISGVTRSVSVTVSRGFFNLSKFTDGQINGSDYIIIDLPHKYTMTTYPESLSASATYWGLATDDGAAPWTASNTYTGSNRNTSNTYASISDDGTVTGKEAGTTTVYGFSRYLLQSHVERTKEIEIIEIVPESITIKVPDKSEYIEGETELDLTGMEVYLNYNKNDLAPYYDDWESYTTDMLKCQVTDYEVSEINASVLDTTQYIIVSVERAGKTLNAVFPITLKSKEVESITITTPDKTEYFEGDTKLDLTGLTVTANYTNADSELVEDYDVDLNAFDFTHFDEPQEITVTYTHAGRSASATFSATIYGRPELTVDVDGITNAWTTDPVVFTLTSTHELDGASYYYRTEGSEDWTQCDSTFTVSDSTDTTIYFKAQNSKGYESYESKGYILKIDPQTPSYDIVISPDYMTNTDVTVTIENLTYGISGLTSLTINGYDSLESLSYTVKENTEITVIAKAANGTVCTQTATVNNIDKEKPVIKSVTLTQVPEDAPSRYIKYDDCGYYYSGDIEAIIVAEDAGVSGIDKIEYRFIDTDYTPLSDWITAEDNKALCSSQFRGYFEIVATDVAGNTSSSYYSDGFTRDADKPVITDVQATCNGEEYEDGTWAADAVEFAPVASAYSGIYEYMYKNGTDGEWQSFTTDYIEVTDEGTNTFYFKAISYSGLESDEYEFTVNIDRIVPLIRVETTGTFGRWTNESVSFTLSTYNECPSGVTYYYTADGGEWTPIDSNIAVFSENTNANYSFKAVNGAGLESVPSDTYKVMIDTVTPSAYTIPGVTDKTDTPYDIAIVPTAGEAGILQVYFNGVDVTDTLTATVSENGTYIITIIGNNLLSSSVEVEITNFDVIPTSAFTYEATSESTAKIVSYNGTGTNVTVPLEIDGYEVTEISAEAFSNKTTVSSVNLPNTVTVLGNNCFNGCENLTKVIIPTSVTEISETAFDGCENVTIYCYEGSYAHTFAVENSIPYVLLDLTPVGKTIINEEAGIIFTQQQLKTTVSDIVYSDDTYNVMGIPSFISGNTQYYGTGSVMYFFKNGSLAYTYKVIVYGDLNGDSCCDVLDCSIAERTTTGNLNLSDDYLLAGDFDSNGALDVTDYQQIVNLSLR